MRQAARRASPAVRRRPHLIRQDALGGPTPATLPTTACKDPNSEAYHRTHPEPPKRRPPQHHLTHVPNNPAWAFTPHVQHSAHPSRQTPIHTPRPQPPTAQGHTHRHVTHPNQRPAGPYHRQHDRGSKPDNHSRGPTPPPYPPPPQPMAEREPSAANTNHSPAGHCRSTAIQHGPPPSPPDPAADP